MGRKALWVWHNVLQPFFTWMADVALPAVGAAFTWLWQNVIQPAFNIIGTVALWLWQNVLGPFFRFIGWVITNVVGPAISWWWENIVQPVFSAIGTVASWLWHNVLQPMFNFIGNIISNYVGPAIMWLWENVIGPAFRGIAVVALWLWQNVISPTFRHIANFVINVLVPVFQKLWDFLVAVFNGIRVAVVAWWRWIQGVFNGLKGLIGVALRAWSTFKAVVSAVWNAVRSAISAAWHWIKTRVIQPIILFFTNTVPNAFQRFKLKAREVWNNVRKAIQRAWQAILQNIVKPAVNFFRNTIPQAFEKFKAKVQEVWNNVKQRIADAWRAIKSNVVDPVVSFFKNNIPAAFERFKQIASNVWNNVKSRIQGAWNTIKSNIINPIISFFKDNIPAAFERFKGIVSSVWDNVKSKMSDAWNWIKSNVIDKITGLPDTIRNALSGLADIISGAFKTAFNAIAKFWNDGPGSLEMDIPDWVPGVGGEKFEMPKIPELAGGGMLRGPGTGTSDSMLARVSNGEFVQRAAAVKKYGTGFMEALNAGKLNIVGVFSKGGLVGLPRFAEGGEASTGGEGGGEGPSMSTGGIKGLDDLEGWQALQGVLASISESLIILAEKWLQLTQILQLDWTAIAGFIEVGAVRIGEALAVLAAVINEHLMMFSADFMNFINVVAQFQNMWNEEKLAVFQEQLNILMVTFQNFALQVTTIFNQLVLSIQTSINNMVTQLTVAIQNMSNTIVTTLQNMSTTVITTLQTMTARIVTILQTMTIQVTTTMNAFFLRIQTAWNAWLTNLTTRLAAWAANTLSRLNAFTATYFNALNAHMTRVQNAWNAWLTNLTTRWAAWAANMLSRLNTFTATYFNALNAFMTRVQNAWNAWLTNLTTRWAEWSSDMTNRFNDWFDSSLSSFRDFTAEMFNTWSELWDRVEQRWDQFSPLVREEIPRVFTELKNDAINIFRDMANGIRTEWDKIEDYTAEPVRFVVETVYNGGIGNLFNAAGEVFEDMPDFSSASVPFARGGIYPGYTPGRDIGLAAVSGGEAIMRPEFTRAVGSDTIHAWNRIARTEGTQGLRNAFKGAFFTGGIVDEILSKTASVSPDKDAPEDFLDSDGMEAAAKAMEKGIDSVPDTGIRHFARRTGVSLWDNFLGNLVNMITPLLAAAGGDGGDTGTGSSELLQAMAAFVRKSASGMTVSSGYRPGDPGYHGRNRAIDMVFSDGSQNRTASQSPGGQAAKAAAAITQQFMANTLELIWDPLKGNAIWNGQKHTFTGGGAGPGTHADHIHWAFGGTVEQLKSGSAGNAEDAEWGGEDGGGGGYSVGKFGSVPKATGLFKKAKDAIEAAKAASSSAALVDADPNVAKTAYEQAKSMNVSDKVLLALFMAGIVESGFRTGAAVRGVDHDSAGFLQQRPSQGWGSVSQVENPAYATREFVSRASAIQSQHSKAGDLAQAVQRSAFPDKYQAVKSQAVAMIKKFDPSFSGGSFDKGGWLQPGQIGINQTTQPEAVLTQTQFGALASLATQGVATHDCGDTYVYVGNEPVDARIEKKHKQMSRKRARDFTSRKR